MAHILGPRAPVLGRTFTRSLGRRRARLLLDVLQPPPPPSEAKRLGAKPGFARTWPDFGASPEIPWAPRRRTSAQVGGLCAGLVATKSMLELLEGEQSALQTCVCVCVCHAGPVAGLSI